jgi:hypothetical protein
MIPNLQKIKKQIDYQQYHNKYGIVTRHKDYDDFSEAPEFTIDRFIGWCYKHKDELQLDL